MAKELSGDFIGGIPKTNENGNEVLLLSGVPGAGGVKFYDIRESHIDTPLTNFSIAYKQEMNFIGDKILKPFPVKKESDKYFEFEKKDITTLPGSLIRGDTSEIAQMHTSLSSTTYTCDELALGMMVSQRQMDNADNPLNPQKDAVYALTEMLMLYREKRTADAVFNATTFASYTSALSAGDRWDDYENSNPLDDKKTAKNSVRQNALKLINTMIVGEAVWDSLDQHPVLLARVVGSGSNAVPSAVTTENAAKIFKVDNLYTGGAVYNSANKGQTYSAADVWGKYVMFCYLASRASNRTVTLGLHFVVQPFKVAKYWVPSRRSWMVEVSTIDVPKITVASAGYLFSTVVS